MGQLKFEKELTLQNGKKVRVFDGVVGMTDQIQFSDPDNIRRTYLLVENPAVKFSCSIEMTEEMKQNGINILQETETAILKEFETQAG